MATRCSPTPSCPSNPSRSRWTCSPSDPRPIAARRSPSHPTGGSPRSTSLREAAAWRLPGILLGALAAGLIYLLARLLFARRSVGLFAAALVLVEGMLFANSRIAMNDVYVTTFILLAAVLFTPVYTGQVRRALDRRPPAHRHRHRARARARIEMGRALRGRRARPSRAPALGPRPLARAGRVHRDDRGPRRRRDPRTGHAPTRVATGRSSRSCSWSRWSSPPASCAGRCPCHGPSSSSERPCRSSWVWRSSQGHRSSRSRSSRAS